MDFLKTVLDSWDGLEDDAKEEITDVIAPSLTSAMLKDIFGAYAVVNKDNKRLHSNVMELLDDLEKEIKEINKKTQDDKKASNYSFSVVTLSIAFNMVLARLQTPNTPARVFPAS